MSRRQLKKLIDDCGLNSQPVAIPSELTAANQRLVSNFYTIRRLLQALQITMRRHENASDDILESRVQKHAPDRQA